MKTFPIAGVHVMVSITSDNQGCFFARNLISKKNLFHFHLQQSASNESQLTLSSVTPTTSGKFSCEVSADFPSFHTMIVSGDMEVVGMS